jgi:hypothetical protein
MLVQSNYFCKKNKGNRGMLQLRKRNRVEKEGGAAVVILG